MEDEPGTSVSPIDTSRLPSNSLTRNKLNWSWTCPAQSNTHTLWALTNRNDVNVWRHIRTRHVMQVLFDAIYRVNSPGQRNKPVLLRISSDRELHLNYFRTTFLVFFTLRLESHRLAAPRVGLHNQPRLTRISRASNLIDDVTSTRLHVRCQPIVQSMSPNLIKTGEFDATFDPWPPTIRLRVHQHLVASFGSIPIRWTGDCQYLGERCSREMKIVCRSSALMNIAAIYTPRV